MINGNLENYFDRPVVDYGMMDSLSNAADRALRLRCSYDEDHTIEDLLGRLLREPDVGALQALIFGLWMVGGEAIDVTPNSFIEYLVTRKSALPDLRALFVGDIVSEENEISWICQGDMSPLWAAFPKLQQFTARGSEGLHLGRINHATLTHLTVETGGMPASLAQEALEANAPLEHLELWLGTDNYGGSTTLETLEPLLDGELFPDLRYLGLKNCEFGDDLAEAVAKSAILGRIEVLDLSMGTVGDRGAEALLKSDQISHLKLLDLSHHYVSKEATEALAAKVPSLKADDKQEPDRYRDEVYYHIAVSE